MALPRLYIIAGPNGAGKSLFSKDLTGMNAVFNGDKLVENIKRNNPWLDHALISDRVNNVLFPEEKNLAIAQRGPFAYETNFAGDTPMDTVREFRTEGYYTALYFIGMGVVEECQQRVNLRVRSGGHYVSSETIDYNYDSGLQNLYDHFAEFDEISIWQNAISGRKLKAIPVNLLNWVKSTCTLQANAPLPSWAQVFAEKAAAYGERYY